jgi:ubiquitin-protein ligase
MEVNSDLIYKNNISLMLLNSNCIKKRVKRELENLYKLFNDIVVDLQTNDSQGILKISICERIKNNKYKYEFIINENYPFVPPKIFYQNKPYINFLRIEYNKFFFDIFKKITGKTCLCCSSYTCTSNWTPAITMEKIIHEIYDFRKYRRDIINKLLADKIKFKYLVDDIELDCWLF